MKLFTLRKFLLLITFAAIAFSAIDARAQCPTVQNPNQSFCDLESPSISDLAAVNNGNGVVWYASPTSTTPLSPSALLIHGQTYYADDNSGSCGVRQTVTVQIYGRPAGENFWGECYENTSQATVSELDATGNNIQWYNVPTGGVPLDPATILIDETIYYASQTNPDTGCETSRLSVYVNYGIVPVPTGPPVQEFCLTPGNTPTVGNLQPTGNVRWYLTQNSAVPLSMSTPLINGQSYFATTLDPPCESTSRLEVVAIIVEPHNSGISGALSLCQNEVGTSIDLFSQLGGAPETTGTWTGPLVTTGGHLGTINTASLNVAGSPYQFTYSVSSAACGPSSSTVTITILPLPTASVSQNVTICSGDSATATFTGTPNATVFYTINGGESQTIVLNSSGSASFTDTYDTTSVIELISISSAGPPSCSQSINGSITITVLPLPQVVISSDTTICSGGSATVNFTGTPNATVWYTINDGPSQTILLDATGNASITGSYTTTTTFELQSISTSGAPPCSQQQTGTVTITVIPVPLVSISTNTEVCHGDEATVTFTGTPDATVTYTVNGGVSQTILLDSNGTATITTTYTTTTIYTLTGIMTGGTINCPATASGSMTVTVLPLPVAAISSDTSICEGDSATVTFTGTPGATVTYTVNGSSPQNIVLDSSGSATVSGTYTTTTIFELQSVTSSGTPACSQTVTGIVTITVVPLPSVTLASSQTICAGETATVTFSGTANATVTFTVNGVTLTILLDNSGTADYSASYNSTTDIALISATTAGAPGCTQPQSGMVTITVIPAPTVAISGSTTVCPDGGATVTFTGTPNATVSYTINGGAVQTIVLNSAGTATINSTFNETTIYEIVDITIAGPIACTQPVNGTVTITIAPLPVVSLSQDTTICSGDSATVNFSGTPNATIAFTINGTNQTITLDANGSASYTANFTVTTTFELVSATSTTTPSCSQPQAGTVVITVLPIPAVTISATSPVCSGEESTVTFNGTPNAIITYTVNGGTNQTIQLDASGIATITATYTETTLFTLITATLEGNQGCPVPLSGNATIVITMLPTASISGTTSICSGEIATITFTGTPGATITFTVNGAHQTITLDSNGNATITNTFTTNTTYELTDVTGVETPGCTAPASGSVIITIVSPPVVSIASDSTICAGQNAIITFTGTPNAEVSYTINGTPATITLNSSGTAVITNAYSVTTVFELASVSLPAPSTCSQPQSGSATVTVLPLPSVNFSANISICAGDSATVTLLGTPNAIVTYTINGGTNQTITLDASGVATITGNYTVTTIFSLVNIVLPTVSGCSQTISGSVTITVIQPPFATIEIMGSNTVCSGQTAILTFTGTPNAIVSYTVNNGAPQTITLNSAGTATHNPTITGTTTFTLISVSSAGTPACIQQLSDSVTVIATPIPNAGTDITNLAICSNAGLQDLYLLLGPDADTGGVWTPTLSAGDGIFDPEVDSAGTYTYTVFGTAPCVDDTASITISIQTPPNAGNNTNVNLCSNGDPQDLFILLGSDAETGGTWSPALASGTSIFDPAIDTPGPYTYTVAGETPCADDQATVSVQVTPGPDAGQDGTLILCSNSASQNLFNSLNGNPAMGGTWSPALASGTGIFNPSVDSAGIYSYTFAGTQPCDNDSATVTVTVNPVPDAGTNGTAFFCTNYAPADLILSLGGNPQAGGTWSPVLASGTGVFDPLLDPPGTYTYSVGGNLCSTSTATVEVTVTQSPNAGGIGAPLLITTCLNIVSVDLFAGLNGTQSAGTWSDDDSTGSLNNNIFNPSVVGAGTYHFTYTVGGGVSPCLFDSATVTVVVDPQPNAGTFTSAPTVCSSVGTFDLTTLLNGFQPNGTWTDQSGQPVTNPVDISNHSGGLYSFTYTVINACGTDAEIVQINVLPNPAFTNANITITSPVCNGNVAIVNFTGLSDGNYILNYSLSGSNVVASQTILMTVAAGVGTITINAASLPNTGITTITFNSILNTSTSCSATMTGVSANFIVSSLSSLAGATVAIADVCLGSSAVVVISNAAGLPNGNYQFNYTLPGTTPGTGSTGIIAINGGSGQFTVPANVFTGAGNFTLTIDNIISLNGCSNFNEATSVPFNVIAVPSTTGGIVSATNSCLNSDNVISIAGAVNLPDGTYTLNYTLSGSVVTTGSSMVTFTGGSATFTIPGSMLPVEGTVTMTITQLTPGNGSCGVGSLTFSPVTFTVSNVNVPVIIDLGDEFCGDDSPTIADLSANIEGTDPVIWYDAPQNGNAYASTDLLQNGVTYYAEYTDSCANGTRLNVKVDLTKCPDILIPDGFSPNDDGINDEFVIRDLPILYPNYKLEIYNRYGNILYKGNRDTANWNGTTSAGGMNIGNNVVPTGVYFYILEFNDGARNPVQGRLYLSR